MRSPTVRSIAYMKQRGFYLQTLEKWVSFSTNDNSTGPHGVRRDVWGCDLLAVNADTKPIMIQTTTRTNMGHRKNKLEGIIELLFWLPWCRVQVHGWYRSTKTNGWHVVVEEMILNKRGVIEWHDVSFVDAEGLTCQKD